MRRKSVRCDVVIKVSHWRICREQSWCTSQMRKIRVSCWEKRFGVQRIVSASSIHDGWPFFCRQTSWSCRRHIWVSRLWRLDRRKEGIWIQQKLALKLMNNGALVSKTNWARKEAKRYVCHSFFLQGQTYKLTPKPNRETTHLRTDYIFTHSNCLSLPPPPLPTPPHNLSSSSKGFDTISIFGKFTKQTFFRSF